MKTANLARPTQVQTLLKRFAERVAVRGNSELNDYHMQLAMLSGVDKDGLEKECDDYSFSDQVSRMLKDREEMATVILDRRFAGMAKKARLFEEERDGFEQVIEALRRQQVVLEKAIEASKPFVAGLLADILAENTLLLSRVAE